jgi:hypothetical protein
MTLFFNWMLYRDVDTLLHLLEHAEFFDPKSYNPVFQQQLDVLLSRITDSEARQQISELRTFDFGSYISRSLLRSGYRDDDQQEAFHHIVVKLLVSPGRLFAGWEPDMNPNLQNRFRRSVWNSIRNIAEKTRNRRRWMVNADPSIMALQHAGRQPYSDLIDQFRSLVAQRLGRLAVAILDARLEGRDMKDLVGLPSIGTPSAFLLKRETRAIKELARQFATRLGDPAFAAMVTRAMEQEATKVAKRQAARQVG